MILLSFVFMISILSPYVQYCNSHTEYYIKAMSSKVSTNGLFRGLKKQVGSITTEGSLTSHICQELYNSTLAAEWEDVNNCIVNTAYFQVGLWIDAGSRYENERNNGTAHFLEHMAFKVRWWRSSKASLWLTGLTGLSPNVSNFVCVCVCVCDRAPGSAPSWIWSWRSRTWALTSTPTHPESKLCIMPKLSLKISHEVWYTRAGNEFMLLSWCCFVYNHNVSDYLYLREFGLKRTWTWCLGKCRNWFVKWKKIWFYTC